MPKKISSSSWVTRLKLNNPTHFNKFDFSIFVYVSALSKTEFTCSICNHTWLATPAKINSGQGCPKCADNNRITINPPLPQSDVIREFIKTHGGLYDYSKFIYTNCKTKSTIICNTCQLEFQQNANSHKHGQGCPICSTSRSSKNRALSETVFIDRASHIHDDKYDYSNIKYINMYTPIVITCPIHGEFTQTPHTHIFGYSGCPSCNVDYSNPLYKHYVYKIINTINDMEYIGIHSTKNPTDSYMGSGRYLKEDQHKYGMTHFTKDILKYFSCREDARTFEQTLLTTEYINKPNTYNLIHSGA